MVARDKARQTEPIQNVRVFETLEGHGFVTHSQHVQVNEGESV